MLASVRKKKGRLLLSLILVSLFNCMSLNAQTVTKTFHNVNLKNVLKEIERQTKLSVIYKVDEVNDDKKVTVTFKKTPVREVLSKVLDADLSFEVENKMITIHKNRSSIQRVQQGNQNGKKKQIKGSVTDVKGEPLIGVSILVKGSGSGVVTDIDGNYTLTTDVDSPVLVYSYIGYTQQTVAANGRHQINVVLQEESTMINEVVVTAMGIQRKEKSLTYATQQVKSEDLMRVQESNVANSLEGKISGITITPNAGGAGGSSKIVLRGNKSILGNSAPLIVVDGVPMSNSTRGQITNEANITYTGGSEGGDPLSNINPDDIESINVLKGANAAALYGSAAANGVVMISTKKGKEGKLSVSVSSNITFDTPLLTPDIQNIYGAAVNASGGLSLGSWGEKVTDRDPGQLIIKSPFDSESPFAQNKYNEVHLRNYVKNDVDEFYRTGVTANNSISLSGGTEKIQTYFSYANSHADGMVDKNSYNRNTFAFRQSYNLFDNRVKIDASINYVQTVTRNRPGGGTVLNPIYHLYTTPRNVDMDYYRDNYFVENGKWIARKQQHYVAISNTDYKLVTEDVELEGLMQNWAYMGSDQNNPYWLTRMNTSKQRVDRVYGLVNGKLTLLPGLDFQARVSFDHTKFDGDTRRYATTFIPSSMELYGRYWKSYDKTTEIYTDYLLSYNKIFNNTWSVSATAGWVGHVTRTVSQTTDVQATYVDPMMQLPSTRVNWFDVQAGGMQATYSNTITNWDKAALFTAQLGWKDMVYLDASYRQDWYRAFRQFKGRGTPESYGYFGVGANAIVSSLAKLPEWISYMKYRASYSEVGNSIPNQVFAKGTLDLRTGAISPSPYSSFKNPRPEKTKSFETGVEASFFGSRLDFDLTYYNAISTDQYMQAANATGKLEPINSGKIRNQGIETTVGYHFRFGKDMRWKTAVNFSYNDNEILETTYNDDGSERLVYQDVAGVRVRYNKGGSIGDMYVSDYKRNADGTLAVTSDGNLLFETEANKKYKIYAGNMNSKYQLGWSNTFSYKDFQLFFLVNGRIGGKVISLTEAYLDNLGLSQRTAEARLNAERNNLTVNGKAAMYLPDGSNRLVPIENYYSSLGGSKNPLEYIYNGTNFRLRELSFGYTFRGLLGAGRNLSVSFIARNLFFLYKDCPTDPDVSLSTGNGLGAFEMFNLPSSRSYGLSIKLTL